MSGNNGITGSNLNQINANSTNSSGSSKVSKNKVKGQKQLNYSKREAEIMKEIFVLLLHRKGVIKELEHLVGPDDAELLCNTLINLAIGTGETLYMIRLFVEDEFKKDYANQEGSIMRGNTLASKLTKAYLSKIGRNYLKQHILGNIVHQIVISESKKSYEIDPTKCPEEDIEKNKQLLLDKLKMIIDQITSPANIDKMPAEMRIIAGYFAELAREYAPKQIWALVGGFLLLRYINPALMTPETYELLPEGKLPSSKARRNLILITKVIQNLSNGVEFGKKEQFMMGMNPFIRDNQAKMEKYLETVVNFTAKTTVATVPDSSAILVTDLHFLHKLFTQHEDKISSILEDKEDKAQFTKLLEKLGSYQSKISFSFLGTNDQKSITSLLEQHNEEAFFIGWVDKKKYNKIQKRLLIVGHYRIISVKPGGKVAREAHLLDLRCIKSSNPKELDLRFANFSIVCDSEEVDDIIICIRRSFETSFGGMLDVLKPKLEIEPKSRITPIVVEDNDPCGHFVVTYKSVCNYYGLLVNHDLCWHIEHLPSSQKILDIRKFTKSFSESPLAPADFGPLFWALRFNTFFTCLIIKKYKLDKEAFLDLAEMMKINCTLQEMYLSDVGGTKDSFVSLFDAMGMNKVCLITHLDVSNNLIEDKGIIALANFISVTASNIVSLNIANTGVGAQGLSSLLNTLKDRVKVKGSSVLTYLNISDNKLSNSSDTLSQLTALAGVQLKSLRLSNTSAVLDGILEGIAKGCPKLELLDISRNKIRSPTCAVLLKYLNSTTCLTELNLSATKFPVECLKNLLCITNNLDLKLNLSENNLGLAGANIIASVPFKMNAYHTLNLSDNDLGDEGIAAIAEALCSNASLKKLILDRNFKGEKKFRQLAVENLSKLITSNSYLESLSIVGGSKAGSQLKADIVPFLHSLGTSTSLTTLNISCNQIGNTGIVALAKALKINHTLTSLEWDENLTGVLGFVNIRNALETNQTLRNMPIPVFDAHKVLKGDEVAISQPLLSKIQQYILRNQSN